MNISIISASARNHSNSLKVAKHLQAQFANTHETRLFSFEHYDIPFVGQGGVDKNNLNAFQQQLIDTWSFGQLIIWVVPEYNWNMPPEFVNTLDQLGDTDFEHLFNNKVFALVGVSSGRGGRQPAIQAQMMLNKLISFLNQHAIVSPRLLESHETAQNLDSEGKSTGNEAYDKAVLQFIDYTVAIARRWF